MERKNVIELKNIVKRFGKVVANKNINLSVREGEIHAIVGENGAGKSTLMNILFGLYQPDEGEIIINGERLTRHNPKNSIRLGIGMVHQHFMLIPTLTVAENVILGQEPTKGIVIDLKTAEEKIQKLSDEYNLKINPKAKVADLSVGENQRVEIIKVLYRGANILILDEPTAILTPSEVREFFKIIKALAAQNKTIIIITHKLDEVMEIADRITVIKQGETIATVNKKETNPQLLARMMVGRDVLLRVEKEKTEIGEPIITITNLSVLKTNEIFALQDINITIHSGEIFGIAGVEGNGQTELIEAIMGLNLDKIKSGTIKLENVEITNLNTRKRLISGCSHIPEDRHLRGLVLDYKVKENIILGQHYFFCKYCFLNDKEINNHSEKLIEIYDIRPNDKEVIVKGLSGGNQQKVIVAREFTRDFKFLLAAQPTRGVDIGAIEFIHKKILEARDDQKAILLISADLNELLSLSDKIGVLYKGRIVKVLDADKTNPDELGMLMTGAIGG
ncbi:MAG TPA: ABC transporter ATP-binding protein [bacterium]|nr:ABC transporter ATP-binding protein [bacterium]HOL46796.1 ABC transporter ATP-binding protein [bacterium]HPQ17751.1 ABC transporter ATP-binding protein [bacterium]